MSPLSKKTLIIKSVASFNPYSCKKPPKPTLRHAPVSIAEKINREKQNLSTLQNLCELSTNLKTSWENVPEVQEVKELEDDIHKEV